MKPLFKASASFQNGKTKDGPATEIRGHALDDALHFQSQGAKTVTILRDSQGKDHPYNAGKYFLELIVK